MSPDQARKLIADAVAMSKQSPFDAEKVIAMLQNGLVVIAPKGVTPDTREGYEVLVRCALKEKYWVTLLQASAALIHADANYKRPALLARALVGLGDYKQAAELLVELKKKYPKDAEVSGVEAVLFRDQNKWGDCLKAADATLKLAEVDEPVQKTYNLALGYALRADALLHLGKLDDAGKAVDDLQKLGAATAALAPIRKRLSAVGASKLIVERTLPDRLTLGTYHLLGDKNPAGALIELKLSNIDGRDRQLKIETGIDGLTEKSTKSLTMLKLTRETVRLTPALKLDFNLSALRAERQAQLTLKISEKTAAGETVLYDDSRNITLLPRDFLPLVRQIGEDGGTQRTPGNIAAWVTPNAKAVDAFLADAKKLHPRKTFSGEQSETMPQVQALFDALKAKGVSYVMDPKVVSERGLLQRTRLPAEVLHSTNAQCLEGTILFATLMESIGLRPIIVLVPGHAFVGWHPSKYDKAAAGNLYFVETTMVGGATFEQAVGVAIARVVEETKLNNFKRGVSQLVELTDLRAAGFKPQPID